MKQTALIHPYRATAEMILEPHTSKIQFGLIQLPPGEPHECEFPVQKKPSTIKNALYYISGIIFSILGHRSPTFLLLLSQI